jgi:thiosulfate/3-mercaptopyruvate sulfurtransferase
MYLLPPYSLRSCKYASLATTSISTSSQGIIMLQFTPDIVDTAWLERNLDNESVRIIDSTAFQKRPESTGVYTLDPGRAAYEQQHIPGALFADILCDFADTDSPFSMTIPSSEKFSHAASVIGIDNDTHVVVYDQLLDALWPDYFPFWASRLWWHLRLEGHHKVSVLEGGLGKWKREGRPLVSGKSLPAPRRFRAARNASLLATVDEVAAAIKDKNCILINVLNRVNFSGQQQNFARPGHIPSSKNLFYGEVIDLYTGQYKPASEVIPLFETIGALNPQNRVIVYCGSGVAATIVALQLARCGRRDVAVYDGSMSEWASDPARPLSVLSVDSCTAPVALPGSVTEEGLA